MQDMFVYAETQNHALYSRHIQQNAAAVRVKTIFGKKRELINVKEQPSHKLRIFLFDSMSVGNGPPLRLKF